jgi:hypothetical protein
MMLPASPHRQKTHRDKINRPEKARRKSHGDLRDFDCLIAVVQVVDQMVCDIDADPERVQ